MDCAPYEQAVNTGLGVFFIKGNKRRLCKAFQWSLSKLFITTLNGLMMFLCAM